MDGMRDLHAQVIMDHSQRPRNRGALENADLESYLLNPLCGDEVTVYAVFDGETVSEVGFTGRGCSISQASASMMTERLVGKTREEAEAEIAGFKARMTGDGEFSDTEEISALGGVVRYPSRIRCATLAWTAFENGLE
jgi:nitrogen fixation NifU-like protein